MILKKVIFKSFHFGRWVVVLKELISNTFHFGQGVMVLKELILTVSTLGRVWWS